MEERVWTADEVIASAVSGCGHQLTDYQRAFLSDASPLRAVLKARQTGFSWLFALEALAQAVANRHFSIFVSLNREEAAEKILYAHDLYDCLPENVRPKLARAGSYEMRFEGGGRLLSFPCRAPRGRAGASLYLDEMAFYPHSERVYAGALPVITHGGRVTVGSTPCGDRGMFWRIVSEPGLAAQYSQHRVPWWHAPWLCKDVGLAAAIDETPTDDRVRRYGTEVLARLRGAMDISEFQQEYELLFVDSDTAFISWDEIEPNVADIPLLGTWKDLRAQACPLYAGVDIGRVAHATEIIVIRDVGGRYEVCFIKSMVNQRFDIQEQAVTDCLRVPGVRRLHVDATGIGRHFSESLTTASPGRVTAVNFTLSSKAEMAKELKRQLQNGTLTIPRQQSLLQQLHTVRRSVLDSGRVRFDAPDNGSDHGDKFWALAMALSAATTVAGGVRATAISG